MTELTLCATCVVKLSGLKGVCFETLAGKQTAVWLIKQATVTTLQVPGEPKHRAAAAALLLLLLV
jgi:hypothetical protein